MEFPSVKQNKQNERRSISIHGACLFRQYFKDPLQLKTTTIDLEAPPCVPPSEASACCFICLEESGVMLVNVCKCSWMRVHPACLFKLTQDKPNCGVCKEPMKKPDTSLIDATPSAVAWTNFPLTSLIDMLLSAGLMALGIVIMGLAAVLLRVEEAEPMTGWIGLIGFYTCAYGLRQLAWHRGEASARGCRAAKVSLMASLTAGSP